MTIDWVGQFLIGRAVLTEILALEEQVVVDAQLAAELDEVAGVLAREETALGRPFPAPDPALRHHLRTSELGRFIRWPMAPRRRQINWLRSAASSLSSVISEMAAV